MGSFLGGPLSKHCATPPPRWIICLLALSGVIGYGFKHGDPRRLHFIANYGNLFLVAMSLVIGYVAHRSNIAVERRVTSGVLTRYARFEFCRAFIGYP